MRTIIAILIFAFCSIRFDPAPQTFPTYEDLWLSRDAIVGLARHHGTLALKITEDQAFIWRDARWIPVLKRNRL